MAFADAGCVLRVDVQCPQCKYKILEVISSVIGVYNVEMDGEEGLVIISGEVDPNMLMRALARTGDHARLIRVNFKHPQWNSRSHQGIGGRHYWSTPPNYPLPRTAHPDHSYTPIFSADYPFRRNIYGCGLPRRPSSGSGRGGYGPYHDHFRYQCNCCG